MSTLWWASTWLLSQLLQGSLLWQLWLRNRLVLQWRPLRTSGLCLLVLRVWLIMAVLGSWPELEYWVWLL